MDARRIRERKAQNRLDSNRIPGLPVDGDPSELRTPISAFGGVVQEILAELTVERSPFFETVRAQWKSLFPDLPAAPGRFEGGKLFLYVRTSGRLFALRPKLTQIKRVLGQLPGAPKKFTLHLEIRAVK